MLAVLAGLSAACGGRPEPPDVVLISIDTLRADHLSGYGYARATSPRIDALGREALVFEDCLSHASDTRLALAALMGGVLPQETSVLKGLAPDARDPWLPVMLRARGYRTAAVVSNYVLRAGRGWNLGFDVYDDTMGEAEAVRGLPERTAVATTDRAIELLRLEAAGPVFLWVHYQDPHGPYTPPAEHAVFSERGPPRPLPLNEDSLSGEGGIPSYQVLRGEDDYWDYVARYDAEIRFADAQVGRLLSEMKRLGLYESAAIVLTSDHGEGMGERDYYFAHGEHVRAPLLRVPLIVKLGNRLKGRRRDPVSHVDVVPTLRKLVGLAADARWRGRDLLGEAREPRDRFALADSPVSIEHHELSLVSGGFQLVHSPETRRDELYDLRRDPNALVDLSGDPGHAARVESMRARALERRAEQAAKRDGARSVPELTDEERDRLRSLGYVQ